MKIRAIQWDFDAWEDYLYWQGQDKKTLNMCAMHHIDPLKKNSLCAQAT